MSGSKKRIKKQTKKQVRKQILAGVMVFVILLAIIPAQSVRADDGGICQGVEVESENRTPEETEETELVVPESETQGEAKETEVSESEMQEEAKETEVSESETQEVTEEMETELEPPEIEAQDESEKTSEEIEQTLEETEKTEPEASETGTQEETSEAPEETSETELEASESEAQKESEETETAETETAETEAAESETSGNGGSAGDVMEDQTAPVITMTPEEPDVDNANRSVYGYYNRSSGDTVRVKVTVTDEDSGKSYSGLSKVTWWVVCNGTQTQSGTWVKDSGADASLSDPVKSISKTIRVKTSANNSCDVEVFVKAVDHAGNSTTKSVKLDIDVTRPTICISYDNNTVSNNSYFNDTRTATIVITERTDHFDADDVKIRIKAVDAEGNEVSGVKLSRMISSWKTKEGKGENAATHTATITYSKDANYTFSISYTDKAGNKAKSTDTGSSAAPYRFTVDTTAPTGSIIYTSTEDRTDIRSSLIKKLTFGFYSANKIKVTGSTDDATSPIASVKYYKSDEAEALTRRELNQLNYSSWKNFKGLRFTSDEQFTIYLKITDYAGNYTYISTDGLIVDTASPEAETLEPEITLTQPVNDLYSEDVMVDVTVTDPTSGGTYSGLYLVGYEVYNMGELTQSGTLYTFSNDSPTQSQLKRSVTGSIQVLADRNNSNDVEIIVYAEDNSGNTSQKSMTCRIDTTAPTIAVSYDNNTTAAMTEESRDNASPVSTTKVSYDTASTNSSVRTYFRESRTATIQITERNFDPDDVVITITNTDGAVPMVSAWQRTAGIGNGDNTMWTAAITFSEDGDYTFAIACVDEAGNAADGVIYDPATIAVEAFTIDRTAPTISVSYDDSDAENGNYYKAPRTATVTITEHNFDAESVEIIAVKDGKSMAVSPAWSTSGDVHTASVSFEENGRYTFAVAYTDPAGNKAVDSSVDIFYVDLANPVIEIGGVEHEAAYPSDTVIPIITITDDNYSADGIEITLEGLRFGSRYSYSVTDITSSISGITSGISGIAESASGTISGTSGIISGTSGTVSSTSGIASGTSGTAGGILSVTNDMPNNIIGQTFTFENIEVDDIYMLTVTAKDLAGNTVRESVRFSVNRNGSTYDISALEDVNGIQLKTEQMEDLVIYETNPNKLSDIVVTLYKNNETIILTEGTDYSCVSEVGENGWYCYTYQIAKELFAEDGFYYISISSVDEAGNPSVNNLDTKSSEIEIFVDNTKPTVIVTNLESDGTYETECYEVVMVVNDNMTISGITVTLDGEELTSWSGEELDAIVEEHGEFRFIIEEANYARTVTITAIDAAGNEETVTMEGFYVTTNRWIRFHMNLSLLAGGVIGMAVLVGGIVFLICFRRRKTGQSAPGKKKAFDIYS